MLGTPFILGPVEVAALEQLRVLAALQPVNMQEVLEQLKVPKLKKRHMRQMTKQTVYLPFGYAVTYSIEVGHPGGRTARHMSMSTRADDRVPRPEAVWMVAEVLGFTGVGGVEAAKANLAQCDGVWIEHLQGHGQAVNVVQLIGPEHTTTKQ